MKNLLFVLLLVILSVSSAAAQGKSNDAVLKQIKALGSSKTIGLTFDSGSNVSKLMAVTDNFADHETERAGIQAMNFALGFMYPGQEIARAPENILLTFWVLTKRPRFAAGHNLIFNSGSRDLGPARYISKPRENMEYLNFEVSRADLTRLVGQPDGAFQIGALKFTFTRSQMKAIADLLAVSDPAK